jgi:hypothetical protein
MIRAFTEKDLAAAREIHKASGLPDNCFPNLYIQNERGELVWNPLFMINAVVENPEGRAAMMAFTKIQGELFLLLDHEAASPEELWKWLQEFKAYMAHEAWKHGLEQLSAWVPEKVEASFAKRLRDLGFVKSSYVCWTLNL